MSPKITYWYHPESEAFYIDSGEAPITPLSVELDEYEYVKKLIEQIDADPEHKLPEGIAGIIKLAAQWPGSSVSGMLWYDKHHRFVNGYPINTSEIISQEPGGIYCTKNNKYLVEMIQPNLQIEVATNDA